MCSLSFDKDKDNIDTENIDTDNINKHFSTKASPKDNKRMRFVHPTNSLKYSCFREGDTYYCTYDDFKSVYFNWRFGTNQRETIVDIPRYIPFSTESYLKYKLWSKVEMRDGISPMGKRWEKCIKDGKCYLSPYNK